MAAALKKWRTLVMKALLTSLLNRIVRHGDLSVTWPDRTVSSFTGTEGPQAGFRLTDWQTVRRLALNPSLAFGEAYMDGTLQPEDCSLYDLLDLLMLNLGGGATHLLMRWHQTLRRLTRSFRQINDARQAQQRVAHHYDLDSRLYTLFLDSDQQYSCAYFQRGDETLEEAQRAKKRLIATKLYLNRPDLTVLDIGCGWGGLALTLAADYGARVTGITLSTEQLALARARAEAAGLAERVQFELADYRGMTGRFDRVVSVGMMEHVGVIHYNTFFQLVRDCLTEYGVALIHHIGRTEGPGASGPWLQKYIFPGGYIPALSEVTPAIERAGLIVTDLETLRLHYARTLRLWRERFASNRDAVRDLYDERFCRMFEFYLAGAELSFRRDRDVVYQFQLSPNLNTLPYSREYLLGKPVSTEIKGEAVKEEEPERKRS
jgi:cyclopropane-fatty-acyl-phospholipid synthase